jgi:cytidylate kinase
MTVITISRQFGSGGDEIADRLCKALNYHHFDKLTIIKAAAESGLSDQEFVDFSEDNYKVQNFFERLLNRPSPLGKARVWREDAEGIRVMEEMTLTEEHALTLVQKAVLSAYHSGNYIIVGRGGQAILRDYRDVLHLRIEAPWEERLQFVREQLKSEKKDPASRIDWRREAQDLMTARDAASADYLQRFYHVDWNDPMLYHLVLNTGRMSIDLAVSLIGEMLKCVAESKPGALAGFLS